MVDLIKLPVTQICSYEKLKIISNGIWGIICGEELIDLNISSSLEIEKVDTDLLSKLEAIFISGALTDIFLKILTDRIDVSNLEIIVRDFSRIFANHKTLFNFERRGGKIRVLQKSNLIAICVNPVSPNGATLNSERLCSELSKVIKLPVYDIIREDYEA